MSTNENKGFLLVTQLGSNWNNSTNSGSFYWNLNNSSSNSNRNISCHLVHAIKKLTYLTYYPGSCQNITIKQSC